MPHDYALAEKSRQRISTKPKEAEGRAAFEPGTLGKIDKVVRERSGLRSIANKAYPQLKLPIDVIYMLERIRWDSYILLPLDPELSPKIPAGKFTFVVLSEAPLDILCFEQDEIWMRKDLRERANGPINYGHSSLAYKESGLSDPQVPADQRRANAAKPVMLAGHLYFHEDENPTQGGGALLSWDNNSGHFKPTTEESLGNRIGIVKSLLPAEKFVPINLAGGRNVA
ncbi:hypothetical protein [Pseudoxanthomonas sp. UTMC 1351]|uniref:hypothetical protein n=1 Tax=Pseudoxanthomonas sp. UTMC 1351 TaxID=2695853 RepID=UPI0034CE1894